MKHADTADIGAELVLHQKSCISKQLFRDVVEYFFNQNQKEFTGIRDKIELVLTSKSSGNYLFP